MDTSPQAWSLTLATAAAIAAITAGYGHVLMDAARTAGLIAWWIISG